MQALQHVARFAPWAAGIAALALGAASALFVRHGELAHARALADADAERVSAILAKRIARHGELLDDAALLAAAGDTLANQAVRDRWYRLVARAAGEGVGGLRALGTVAGPAERREIRSVSGPNGLEPQAARMLESIRPERFTAALDSMPPAGGDLVALDDDAGKGDAHARYALLGRPVDANRGTQAGFVFILVAVDESLAEAMRGVRRAGRYKLVIERPAQPPVTAFEDPAPALSTPGAFETTPIRLRFHSGDLRVTASVPGAPLGNGTIAAALAPLALAAIAMAFAFGPAGGSRARDEAAAAEREKLARAEELIDGFAIGPDAVVVLDVEGRIKLNNPAAETMFRVPAGALVGKPIGELLPDCDAARLTAGGASGQAIPAQGRRRARLQATGQRRGGRFPVEVHIGVRAERSEQIVCTLRDISEQRRTEEEMRLYKRALASSSDAVVISDVTLPDQPIIYVNEAFERITGYDLADAFGRNQQFLEGPDTDPGAIAKMKSAIERGVDCRVTVKHYHKDGTPFWNQITLAPVRDRNGQVTHYVAIEADVTERMQVEAALEERRRQIDGIFNLSPDGFVAFSADNRVSYANPAFLRMAALEHDDVHGASIEALDRLLEAHKDPAQTWVPLVAALAEADENTLQRRGASAQSARYQDVLHLRNPAPKVIQRSLRRSSSMEAGFVLYLRDITRESEVDRMKSEFLSSAAHELRTPMASIFGFAELLLRKKYPPERQKEMLETIHRQAKLLTNLVNELLDLARIEARAGKDFKLIEQPLEPIIRETVASLLMPNDSRQVEVELPPSLPLARVDNEKLHRAIMNLLSNAYKYSPNGGRIRLWTDERAGRDKHFIGIRVADEGLGMTPEQLAKCTERFYRADTSGNIPGTGLGLSLVKEIMTLMGGTMELESEYGKGTTVSLWLPISSREAPQCERAEAVAAAPAAASAPAMAAAPAEA